MDIDNTQDGAEPSLASAGSQPVGWGAVASDGSVVCMMRRRADVASYVVDGTLIVPLYRHPQPTLTDAEREAIAWAAREADEWDEEDTPEIYAHAEVLAGLFRRLT
jgi:hypothetical protein